MSHKNNFGFLRLSFAMLVIVSHSPELVDGNRSRELLTQAFGTLSFGELAVDGFFLISGYLIVKSYGHSSTTSSYLLKRALRIYPGFLAAYFICLIIIAPLVGGSFADLGTEDLVRRIAAGLLLASPKLPGTFGNLPYSELNGALWTVQYEFSCYLAVICFAWARLYHSRWLLLTLTAVLLFVACLRLPHGFNSVRFLSLFCTGSVFYVFRDKIPLTPGLAVVAGICLVVALCFKALAGMGVAIFGGYLVFWTALGLKSETLAAIGTRHDLSYGVYLYAWPIQQTLIYLFPGISPWANIAGTVPLVLIAAYLSWNLVEAPALSFKKALATRRSVAPQTS